MTDRPKSRSEQARAERLSKALRENLKRRKAQLRGRTVREKDENSPNLVHPRPER
jgi:hypothetical protein